MIKTLVVFFTIIFLASIKLLAQNPYIQHYTTNDGLPSNMVYQVYQDSHKFIWFATDAGVARFDGSRFVYYRKQDGLACNDVVRIKEDSFGRIWFFNLNATLNFYYKGIIYNPGNAPYLDSLKSKEFFRDFYEDTDKNIHFYYNHQREIFTLNSKNQVTKFILPSINFTVGKYKEIIEGMVIRYLSQDSEGMYLLWTIAGLYTQKTFDVNPRSVSGEYNYKSIFKTTKGVYYAVVSETANNSERFLLIRCIGDTITDERLHPISLNTAFINSVIEDVGGLLWISTFDKGIFCFKDNSLLRQFDIKEAQAIIQDHEKNVWITSLKDGVYKICPNIIQHTHYENGNFGGKGILVLADHLKNGIWFTNGEKIYLLQNEKIYTSDFSYSKYSFNQILHLRDNSLLVGEKNIKQFIFENIKLDELKRAIEIGKSSISPKPFKRIVSNLTKDKLNCFNSYQLYILDPDKSFVSVKYKTLDERIYNIYYNYENELIVNAKKNYIYRNDSLLVYPDLSCFDNKIITDHLNINESTDLINIEGDSLFLLNNRQLYNLTSAYGLPIDKEIKYMDYHQSTLFIATSQNVYVCENPLNIINGKPVNLNPIDINFRNINDIIFSNNQLYVASDDGLTAIPYPEIQKNTSNSPIPYFQSIWINDNNEVDNLQNISLTGRNRIHFIFNSINYSTSPVIFSYMLVGSDDKWTVGSGTDVVYQNLPRGEYVFRLKARKPTSPWSKSIEYRITIKATIWQHPLFYAFLAVCIVGLIFMFALRRKNLQLKRRETDHQMITLEQKALQSMMNPHFIFNALGSIQYYLLQNKPAEAGLYLSQFARLIRQNLSAIDSALINLEEETDRLKNYMDLEKLRMEDKFYYTIEFDKDVDEDEVLIPSMIIQPFVENAIWHGISTLKGRGMIRISFAMQSPKTIKISIEDNGVGIKQAGAYSSSGENHLHMGMAMTQKRLEIIGKRMNIQTSVTISETSPGSLNPGTRVVLLVPVSYGKATM
ncbi:MAG: hypothetical protein CVT94_05765 [Bacteroidetes bacterium HGW-Bacteroidetes-11]|nr:MAG: hypothetical protein CVT94_05765 [Bacteroidetes bacterium HGW-Bacteroidetes-11]